MSLTKGESCLGTVVPPRVGEEKAYVRMRMLLRGGLSGLRREWSTGTNSVLLSPSCSPKQNSEVCLPRSSSPMLLTTVLQTRFLFLLLNPFLSFKTPYVLYPRLGLQWPNK